MTFDLKYLLGSQEVYDDFPQANTSISKGDFCFWVAGYADGGNQYASATCANALGIAHQTVDNSGGSDGDTTINVQLTRSAVYEVGTTDTMTQAYCGYNCALASATTITSAAHGTDITGVFKILKMISASKVQGTINFGTTADT